MGPEGVGGEGVRLSAKGRPLTIQEPIRGSTLADWRFKTTEGVKRSQGGVVQWV